MDNPVLFQNFITNVAGVTVARARNELLQFADTFMALLLNTEKELDSFMKNTHASNSACANNQQILIPTGAVMALKAVLFELKDRDLCNALPNQAMLQALNAAQISILQARRTQALQDESQITDTLLPSMEVPKLTATNYETFIMAFTALAARTKAANGTTLDYLIWTTNGNYEAPGWVSRAQRLKACVRLNGPRFL